MTKEEYKTKKDLLNKCLWSYKDIMNYFDVGRDTAYRFKNNASSYGGRVFGTNKVVRADTVLSIVSGTTREREKQILEELSVDIDE